MSRHDGYTIGIFDELQEWIDIVELNKLLDKNDFLPKGYYIKEEKYLRKPIGSSTSSSSRTKFAWNWPFTPLSKRKRSINESIDMRSDLDNV